MRGSKFNAIKHGIFAALLPNGDDANYVSLLSALRRAIRPADSLEEILVEKLSFLYLRLARVYNADWRVAPRLFKKVGEALDADSSAEVVDILDAKSEVVVCRRDPAPDLIVRYEANVERQISRTMSELEQWRTIRANGSKQSKSTE